MAVTKTTRRSPAFLSKVLSRFGAYIDGSIPDTHRIGSVFWSVFPHEMFKRMHRSFEMRAAGGSDDLGNTWPKLARSTVASRPIGRGNLSSLGLDRKSTGTSFKARTRGLLSPYEDRVWRRTFASVLNRLILTMGEAEAKEIAAKMAWAKVKRMGAKTKLDVLGNRNVFIMRVTDRLYESLRPSAISPRGYRPRRDQLYRRIGNNVVMGTLVEYAEYHEGKRPVIPDYVDPWIEQSADLAVQAAVNHFVENVA